ncbi:cell division cycle 6 isoform X2 [Rhodnius prolixus]|uniref:cell division cycle 6 isoform X2 n=1 Tax=Rhodnius prolixus TaxID=13249 RepID=UPI003D18C209
MSKLQTTIPFQHRKSSSLITKKQEEKENSHEEITCAKHTKSPIKIKYDGSPIKERNGQRLLKRTSLQDENAECSPPKQEPGLKTSSNELLLSSAIKALHSTVPSKLPGREDQIEKISSIFYESLDSKKSSTLYISGPPGTGKTACLNYILQLPKISKGFKTVYINCAGVKSSNAVYQRVADELGLKLKGRTEKTFQSGIYSYLSSNHKMILLILDEIDQLESKRQSTLYSIFEWPLIPDSNIVLVGIANALDLTDRVLPRLKAKINFQPVLVPFAPYSKQQIIDILKERLTEVGVESVLTGGALQLLASKLAAISGDIRRALDLARRVIELARNNEKDGKSVTLEEVLTVVNNVYSTSATLISDSKNTTSEPFPIQQKLLICTALLIRQQSKSKELTVGKLHETYKKVCEKRNFSALGLSEFLSLAQLAESRGVIKINGKTQNRLSKVSMQWDEKEVANALKDKELLASILLDTSCL